MLAAPIPGNDKDRVNELYRYELLDTVYEDDFDNIVRLASQICNVPMSLITLIDIDRQWFKAKLGLDGEETERRVSFCGHAIMNDGLFEVADAATDTRFSDNPYVLGDPYVRYYAGMPLVTPGGYKLGTLCVLDRVPRQLDKEQQYALEVLSKQVIKLFELRLRNKELKKITDVQQKIITILAHDIRNPLAGLKGTLDLKKEGLLTEEDQRELNTLTEIQLAGTIDMLDNIVDWGKLQLNDSSIAPDMEPFNLHEACEGCFRALVYSAKAKNNALINDVDPQLIMNGHGQGISFMMRNLLGNANKFTTGGTITVSAALNEGVLQLSIKDTGVGMSEKAKASLMERTWSNTERGTGSEKGSGVGLKLIFEYLQDVNGAIEFISAPGEGTTVNISIPVITA